MPLLLLCEEDEAPDLPLVVDAPAETAVVAAAPLAAPSTARRASLIEGAGQRSIAPALIEYEGPSLIVPLPPSGGCAAARRLT